MRNYGRSCCTGVMLRWETGGHVPTECGRKTVGRRREATDTEQVGECLHRVYFKCSLLYYKRLHTLCKKHNIVCNLQGSNRDSGG